MSFGGIGGAQEALAYFIKAYDEATPVFRAFGAEVEGVTKKVQASLTEMNRAMEAQSKKAMASAAEQDKAMQSVGRAQMGAADATVRSSRIQSDASKKAVVASNEQAAAAKRAAETQVRAAEATAASFGRSGSTISKIGRDILIATAGAAAGSLDLAAKFQANTLRMETQAGATTKQLDQLREGLLKMASQVGSTPDQLANGMYHVVSAMNQVLPASQRVRVELQIMKAAAEGAQVGHSHLEDTTYALASAMNALHAGLGQANTIMGDLNATVGSGDMTMQDLVDAYKSGLIPTAREFGTSLASVNAALAVMGDMGMRGALAGTRLRMAMSLLGAPTKQAADILRTLGMTSEQALASTHRMSALLEQAGVHLTTLSSDLRKPDGLKVALQDLDNHLKSSGLSAEGAAAAISRAFGGGRMGAAIALLAENTNRIGLKFDYINQKAGTFGADWQKTSESFRVQVDKALAAVEAFGISFGERLIPPATKALHEIENLAGWFAKSKTALDILAGTVITFSSVAIGSYLISKLKAAVELMKGFGGGIASMGRWMFGAPGGGGSSPVPVAGGPSGGSLMGGGGLWGINATQIRVGSMMNPIAVAIAGHGSIGGAAAAGTATQTAAMDSTITDALTTESALIRQSMESIAATLAKMEATQTAELELDRLMAATESDMEATATEIAASMRAPAGGFMGYKGGQMVNAGTREMLSQPAGMSSLAEMKAAEERAIIALQSEAQIMAHQMGQTAQDLGLFNEAITNADAAAIKLGEQLSVEGIMPGGLPGASNVRRDVPNIMAPATSMGMPTAAQRMGTIDPVTGQIIAAPGMTHVGTINPTTGALNKLPSMMSQEELLALQGITLGTAAPGVGMTARLRSLGGGLTRGAGIAGMGVLGAQMVGSMVGGSTGGAISSIGTTTSIGAGLGSLAGPWGTAIGGALGAAMGVAMDIFKKADYGKQLADSLSKGFGGATLHKTVTDSLDAAKKITDAQTPHTPGIRGATGAQLGNVPLTPEQVQQREGDFQKAGQDIAKALEKGWNQYKFQTEPIMFSQLRTEVHKMPPEVQATAIQSAIVFSLGLERSGKIAKGSTQAFLKQAESEFPGFTQFLGLSAQASVEAFKKNFDFTKAEANLKKTMDNMRGDFPAVTAAMDATTGDVQNKSQAMIVTLQGIVANGTGPVRKQAIKDLNALTHAADSNFSQLAQLGQTNTKKLRDAVSSNTGQAFQIGTANFKGLAQNIAGSIGAGAEATAKGLANITSQVNASLKLFGEKPLSASQIAAATPGQLAALASGQVSSGGFASPVTSGAKLATGGLITSPSIMVGEEAPTHPEYVLATNPAYRTRNIPLWAKAGKDLGIPGFATGGIRNHGTGGYVFPFGAGLTLGRTDQGLDMAGSGNIGTIGPAHFTRVTPQGQGTGWPGAAGGGSGAMIVYQLTGGPDAGRYVYLAENVDPLPGIHTGLNAPAGTAYAHARGFYPFLEEGWATGGSGTPTAAYHAAQYPSHSNTPEGIAFTKFVEGLAHGQLVGGGPGGPVATWKNVTVPKWTGPGGAVGQIGKAVLKLAVTAANKFGQSRAGSATGSPFTGSLVGSVEHQVDQFFTAAGMSKIGIAGLLGNAMQESSMSWGAPGGGLWQQITNFGSGAPSPIVQMTKMLGQIRGSGVFARMNAARSPAEAAIIFEQGFEHAGIPAMGNRIAAANAAFAAGYKRGGKVGYAGAFGHGGGFTANSPTLAMFGDNGPESVFAIPHAQMGGMFTTDAASQGPNTPAYPGAGVGRGPGGKFVALPGHAHGSHHSGAGGSSSSSHKAIHRSTHFNPLTDRIESHTAQEWALIHAEAAKQRHDALIAKEKYDKWLAQQITDTLTLGGQSAGSLELSRKELNKLDLPIGTHGKGGKFNIFSILGGASSAGFSKIESALKAQLGIDSTKQIVDMAGAGATAVSKSALGKDTANIEAHIKATERAKAILEEHHKSVKQVNSELHVLHQALNTFTNKLATSRPAQLENIIIGAGLKSVSGAFNAQQTQFTHATNVASLLGSLGPGTNIKSLGLNALQLKSMGLTSKSAQALIGGTTPAAYAAQISYLTKTELPQYQQDATRLQALYKDSLKTHNKKLQQALLTQLDAVTQAQVQAQADIQKAMVAQIEAIYSQAQSKNATTQSGVDIVGAVSNLSGVDLSSLGLSPGVLAHLGLGGQNLSGLMGNANPMASAQLSNSMLGQERGTDVGALNDLIAQLPSLSGDALDTANQHIQDLSKSILSLTDQINQNLIAAIQATAKGFQDTADLMAGGTDLQGAIQNLAPGTNLSALGLSPAILDTLGIGGAGGLEGTGLNYISNLQSQQGGNLTADQIAAAKRGVDAQNAGLKAQEAPLIGELGYYQSQLPSLTGQSRTDAITAMLNLAKQITSLEGTMASNTDAVNKLTTATNQNTSATGQMTGIVSYQYQGQSYLAGLGLSSDSSANLGVGS